MNRFPVLEHLKVENYRLYPGTDASPGIDFKFDRGVSLLAGINGLGKTTLINMLFRLIVGPYDLKKDSPSGKFGAAARSDLREWSHRTKFFTQRVADRAGTAHATLTFRIGRTEFLVSRALNSMRLRECVCDGQALDISKGSEEAYRAALLRASNSASFADFLTAVKYLTFFNEERRDVLWDEQAQRQFFRILFSTPEEALEWSRLESEISRTDSRARNISATAFQYSEDLSEKEQLLANVGAEAKLAAEQKLQDADLQRRGALEAQAAVLESDLKRARRDLERTKIVEDDARRAVEEMRFGRLSKLFPNLSDTAQYVLTQLYSGGRCLACEQHAPAAQRQMEGALEKHLCVVCGTGLATSPNATDQFAAIDGADFNDARAALDAATVQRHALVEHERAIDTEWRLTSKQLAEVGTAIITRSKDLEALRSQLPPDPEDVAELRRSIEDLKQRERAEIEKRQTAEAIYERLLAQVSDRIQKSTERVSGIFGGFISRFLEEDAKLTFKVIMDRPSVGGRRFQYPSLRFEMTAAAFEGTQIRETPDDVSESQREFIDLAFRMALMEASSEDQGMSLVIETPEASLDAVFMTRAADMFRSFAHGDRSLVITSNLTSSVMIPALFGAATTDPAEIEQRRKRILNLLDIAAPNAAIRHHKAAYQEFLERGLRGGVA